MGLREKVTITLVIIALIQIACRHCMPRTPRKATLKRYLNDLKPVKNNPVPAPYSSSRVNKTPKQKYGKTAQNGRISQNSLPTKSLYETYNFPDNEYPLDNFPRDRFRIGMNFNENNHENTLQKARNLQSSAISDLKKGMKMKRKLLSNKQVNNANSQSKTDMSSIKSSSNPAPIRLLDSETFPEVQYPLNSMDTWGPNYWNYLPFTEEKPFHRFEQQTFNPNFKEDIIKPFTRLTKAKARKYLQSYDKLKEEHIRTSSENSKRSNVGQKGLNFTKTATCEGVSDDFIVAGLVSNIPSNSTEMKKALTSSTKLITSSENTCAVTEYPYHSKPIPYKVIEENTENICPAHELKNITKELQDVDNNVIAQTLQLIQEILSNDDTSSTVLPGNYSKEIEKNMNISDYTVVSANEDVSTTRIDSAKTCTESPTEELSQEVSDDVGNLQNMTSFPEELIPENTTTVTGPLNVRMPLPFSEPTTYEALTNALNPGPSSNGNAVPGSTSIIIIPFNNNAVGKSQSHMFGTSPDTPIIVYLPSTQSSAKPSQPSPFHQIVSSSVDRLVPNNQLYNVLSNMAPLQNDKPFATALISESLNSNTDSGSSLPIHETLPTNSMCYNNESSPSSMREKLISDILIDKSLTDDATFDTTICDENLSEQLTETGDLHVNTNTRPPMSEHPLFDFSGSDFTSLSRGPYNNMLHNELPMITREINSDQQILNVSSKDLFIPTQNVTSEHLHKTTSMDSVSEDSMSEIPNDVPPVALDKKFSSVTLTDSIEIVKTSRLLPESIPNVQEPIDTHTENLPQPINKILLSTLLIEPPTAELSQPKELPLSPTPLFETVSDKLPMIMDTKLPITSVLDTTTQSAPQQIDNTPSHLISNSSPMMTDMTLKTELYKIRQILDKMLSTETPTNSQSPPTDTTLLPISDSECLLLPMNETHSECVPVPTVYSTLLPLPATDNPIDSSRQLHETLPPISVDETPTDTLSLPENKMVIPNKLLETDTPLLPVDESVPTTQAFETSAINKPYLLDNLVTPLSGTVTSRTKATTDNGLSHKMDDLPFKMDLKFPYIYEVSSDDLPLSVDDLPTIVHPEHTTNLSVSKNNLPTLVVGTPVSEVPVSDLPKTTEVLPLPVHAVLEGASPDVPTDSLKTLMNSSIDKLLQDFPSSKDPSDGLPILPMNVFKLSIHETYPDGQFSSKEPPQKYNLPLSVPKFIPDMSVADAIANEPSVNDYLPSLVDKNIEFPYSIAVTKDLPLVVEHLLSPGNYVTSDTLVTDTPSAVLLSTNLEELKSTNLDKTSDEVSSESNLSELPRDDLPLPKDKMLPLSDSTRNDLSLPINKTASISKLPITKSLLENVLSDITKGGLSSLVDKTLLVTPHSPLDKKLHYVDVKSPLSKTKEIPQRPVEKIFPNPEHTDNLIYYVPFSEKPADISITDLPSEMLLPMDEMHKNKLYIPTDDEEDHDKKETQSLGNPTHNLPVPIDKVPPPKDTTKTPPSSKLSITKALLQNVLSDINTKGFSLPTSKALPVATPHALLHKTLHYVDVKSPVSETNEIPQRPVEKIFPNPEHTDNLIDYVPFSEEPVDISITDLPSEMLLPMDEMHKNKLYIPTDDEEDHDKKDTQSLGNPTHNLPVPIDKVPPPKDTTKTPPSSKLSITKALLENVLSDINTRGFPLPAGKALPVTTPHALLDKSLHYVDVKSPVSETNEIPQRPVEQIFPNPEHTNNLIDYVPFSEKPVDISITDLPSEMLLPTDEMHKDKPYIPTEDEEYHDQNETQSLGKPTHDLPVPIDKVSPAKDTTKTPSSSKLSITKALLENVLSDINTRGFSLPAGKAVPVTTPHALLDKSLHYVDVKSPVSETNEIPQRPVEKIFPNPEHTDNLIDYVPFSEKPVDISITDLPSEMLLPMDEMQKDKSYIPTDDEEDHDKKETQSLGNPTHNLPVPIDKVPPPKDTTKTPPSSKLSITKALLQNVLSDINTKGFSLPTSKALPVATPHALLHKTLHYVDVKSPVSETNEIPQRPVEKIFPNPEHTDNLIDYVPFSEEPVDISITDLPSEMLLPMDEMHKNKLYIPTDDEEDHDKKDTQSLGNPTHNLPVPIDKVPPPKDTTKTPPSSKLSITKALLENVLSDINTRGFPLPAGKALPVTTPHALLDKSLHYVDVKSPVSETNEIPQRPVEQIFPNPEHTNNLIDYVPFSEKPVDISITDLPSEMLLPTDEMHKDKPYIPTEDEEYHDQNETQSLGKPTHDLPVPIDKVSPAKDTTKTPSSSKLSITKALLENVLSDINTRGFSLPAGKAVPVTTPHALLDKSLHYVDVKSPVSETNEIPQRPVEKIFPNPEHTDNLIDYVPFSEKPVDISITDLPSEMLLPMDEMHIDKPYIPTEDVEDHDKNETQSLHNPPVPTDKVSSLKEANKTPSSSKLPIAKALLQNVLSDINTRGFSLPTSKALPVTTPHALLDKSLHYVDVKSPVSETNEIPQRPVEKIFPNPEHTDNLIYYVPFSEKPVDISITDLPSEMLLPMDEMHKNKLYIPTDDEEDHDKKETQSLGNPTHNLPVPIDKVSPAKDTTKTPSSSKLSITKALLENVLSDINTRGFSLPAGKAVPVTTPHALLDKSLHYVDVKSPVSETNEIPQRPVEKIFPNLEHTGNLIDYLPFSEEPVDTSITDLPSEMLLLMDEMHKDKSYIPTEDVEHHDKNETQSLHNPPVPTDKVSSLKEANKTPSSSKLPIAKALLQNVLSDINTRGFSLPTSKALPVTTPHALLDKSLYYIDVKSPVSETNEIPQRPVEQIFPNPEHTDNLIDYVQISEEPVDTSITDLPSEMLLPMDEMQKDKSYIPTDDEEDHDQNKTQLLGNPTHNLPVPIDKVPPPKDTTKTPISSKLSITKALLQNVLSDINTKGFSLPTSKALPVTTPHALLDKSLHYVDVKSPVSETNEIPQRPVEKIFPNPEHTDNLIDYVPFSEKPVDISITDLPSEMLLPMDEMHIDKPYIPTEDVEDHDKNETQSLHNPPVPTDKVSSLKEANKTPSSSKLPIAKALLQNVLSDINTRGFSLPTSKALPVTTPHALLDKSLHYVDGKSPVSETNEIPQRPVEKIFPNPEHTDNLIYYVPFSEKPVDISITDLPSEMLLPMDEMHKNKLYIPTDDEEDHDKKETQSLGNPTHNLPVPIDKVSPAKDTTKTPSSSKLSITKALLENVLSDINTRGFSLPAGKAVPVTTPHALLDKSLHYVDVKSPVSETNEIPQRPVEKIFPNLEHTGNLIDYLPFSEEPVDTSITDLPSEMLLLMDEMHKDKSYIPTEDVEHHDKNETQSLHNPPVPTDKVSSLKEANKTPSSSKLPIAKALLQNVLSDINTRGFSLPTSKALPVTTPHALLDKSLYYIDVKSPVSETNEIPQRPVEQIFPNPEHTDNLIDYVQISEEPVDTSITDLPSEMLLPMDEMQKDKSYIPTDDEEDHDQNKTQLLGNPTHNLPVPIDKVPPPKDTTKTPISSKLSITKALLQNVLSDINTKGFSLPTSKALPVTTPHALLDKSLHYVDVKSPVSETNEIPQRPVEKIFPNPEHTDNLIDYVPFSEKPVDISITDLPSEMLLPMDEMHIDKPYIPTEDVEDHDKNETQSLHNPPVPTDKVSSLKEANKTPSSSKLPIAKALLQNVLSDINTRGFSLPTSKALPVTTPHALLDKSLHYIDVKSPVSETNEIPQRPVEQIFPNAEHTNNLIDYVQISEEPVDTSITDLPSGMLLPMDEMHIDKSYIPTDDEEDHDQNKTQLLGNPTHNLPVPIDKVPPPKDTTKTPISSKLSITKALLQNVLSDINTKGFSLPTSKALPVTTPHALLDKSLHYVDVKSPVSETNEIPQRPVEQIFPNAEHTNNLIDYVQISEEPVDTSITDLPSGMLLPMDEMHIDKSYIPTDDEEDHDQNKTQLLGNPTHNLPVPIDKVPPPKDTTKTPISSKLSITKALLQNVLSDINTKGFSLPTSKALPVTTPHALLDKSLHYVDVKSPVSETNEIPQRPVEKIFPNPEHTDNLIDYVPFSEKPVDISITDLPSEMLLPTDEMHKDKPYIPTEDVEDHDQNETQSLGKPTHDLPVPIDKVSPAKDTTKTPSSSKLSITKALLENVLSDINTRGFSLPAGKAVPVTTPHALLDKSLHYVDVKSPVSETNEIPQLPVEKIFPNPEHTDNLIDYVPFSEKPVDISITDLPSEMLLPMDEMHKDKPYIPTEDVEDHDKNETQSLHNPPVPTDKVSSLKEANKTPCSSKLPIAKALLQNVLSDINTRGFSLPTSKALPVTTPHTLLDKSLHYVDVKSPVSETNEIPQRPVEQIFPNPEHTNNLIDYVQISEEPVDTSITDFPSEMLLPMDEMQKDKSYIPTEDVEDHDKKETQSSGNPTHNLPVPIDKVPPPKDTTKTPSSSKLSITKALLENVLSDINTRGFSLPAGKALPVTTPHALLDKSLHFVDVKSPVSETNEIPQRPVEKIFPNPEHTDNLIDYVPFSEEPVDTSITDLPSEMLLPMDEMHIDKSYISTEDVEDHDKKETQSSGNPTHNLPVPIDKVPPPKDTTKTPSSSKLSITKALLENVLSDINTRGFSLPTSKALPVTTPNTLLDKSLHYVDVKSPVSETNEIPQRPVEKIFPNPEHTDNLIDYVPFSEEPVDTSITDLSSEMLLPTDEMHKNKLYIPTDDEEDHDKKETQSLGNPTHDLPVPIDKVSSAKDTTKTPSSSKLTITKALLDNVLSDMNTRGFSLPVAEALPVAPRSQLDKTLYFLDSPVFDMTEKSSVILNDNFPSSGINEDVRPRPTDKTLTDNPVLDIPTDFLRTYKIHNSDILTDDVEQEDKSDILTDDVEDRDKSNNLMDDVEYRDTSENFTDDIEIEDSNESYSSDDPTDDMPRDVLLPRTTSYLASRIPITKALLEKVLSDITDGGIHP